MAGQRPWKAMRHDAIPNKKCRLIPVCISCRISFAMRAIITNWQGNSALPIRKNRSQRTLDETKENPYEYYRHRKNVTENRSPMG